jgi:hypothetical protein
MALNAKLSMLPRFAMGEGIGDLCLGVEAAELLFVFTINPPDLLEVGAVYIDSTSVEACEIICPLKGVCCEGTTSGSVFTLGGSVNIFEATGSA